jgi:type I protein arginine methyltransferase
MYSLYAYGGMIGDPTRVGAYEAALKRAIRPGSTVVEIGAGTGYFTVLACRLGAGHVYAIEPDPAVQVAKEVVEVNGVADRVTFFETLSTQVELPEPADVLFSDLRGILPLLTAHVESVRDARTRLLRPGGIQIPQVDRIRFALVESESVYRGCTAPWGQEERGIDLAPAGRRLANGYSKARFKPEDLLSCPVEWVTLDYRTITEPNVSGSVEFEAARPGTAHGLVGWFDSELLPGIGFSNAPDAPKALYGHKFFPFPQPIACEAGDRFRADIGAHLVGGDYVWSWHTRRIQGSGDPRPGVRFTQSTLAAVPLSSEHLRRSAEDHRPVVDVEAKVDAFVLTKMDGTAPLRAIAERLLAHFPDRFREYGEALDRVVALSCKYSA